MNIARWRNALLEINEKNMQLKHAFKLFTDFKHKAILNLTEPTDLMDTQLEFLKQKNGFELGYCVLVVC